MDKKLLDELNINPFTFFNDRWALLTAGSIDSHNSMTISWGELGTLWHRNVVTVYVKPVRYTYQFMNDNDYFVLSFFKEDKRKALSIMGSKSGRDINKDEASGLTPISYKGLTTYKEAELTFICKKIYWNDLDINNIPDIEKDRHYQKEEPHRMFVGEIIEIIK